MEGSRERKKKQQRLQDGCPWTRLQRKDQSASASLLDALFCGTDTESGQHIQRALSCTCLCLYMYDCTCVAMGGRLSVQVCVPIFQVLPFWQQARLLQKRRNSLLVSHLISSSRPETFAFFAFRLAIVKIKLSRCLLADLTFLLSINRSISFYTFWYWNISALRSNKCVCVCVCVSVSRIHSWN